MQTSNRLALVLERFGQGFTRMARALDPDRECSTRESRTGVQPGSLLHYASDVYSQRGDDGIIREIFRRLGIAKGYFAEFGAWDGIHHSNARLLFESGWSGMFIEADRAKAKRLKQQYSGFPDITCINGMVGVGKGRKTFDEFCAENSVQRIDFLSIDIDGLDLNVFETLQVRPTVVAIEGGFSWHPQMTVRVPDEVAAKNLQQPLSVTVESVKARGYEPICFNQNLYAVESDVADRFTQARHDAESLWLDAYYAQSEQFRCWLSGFRRNHTLIHKYELPYRPGFSVNV